MSDPPEGAKATTASAPTTKEPTAPRSASGAGSPRAGKALDLSAWAEPKAAAPTAPTPTAPARERFPLFKWEDLAGISGLALTDVWVATSEPKPATQTSPAKPAYDYVGANVRLPPNVEYPAGAMVTVLTGADTTAGARLKAEFVAGHLDGLFAAPPKTVPIHVLNRRSPNFPTGRPYSVLTVG